MSAADARFPVPLHYLQNARKGSETFAVIAYKSGDNMYGKKPLKELSKEELTAIEQRHLTLFNELLDQAEALKRLDVQFYNFDGRFEPGDPDAEVRSALEEKLLNVANEGRDATVTYHFYPLQDLIGNPVRNLNASEQKINEAVAKEAAGWGNNTFVIMHCSVSKGRTGGVLAVVVAATNKAAAESTKAADNLLRKVKPQLKHLREVRDKLREGRRAKRKKEPFDWAMEDLQAVNEAIKAAKEVIESETLDLYHEKENDELEDNNRLVAAMDALSVYNE